MKLLLGVCFIKINECNDCKGVIPQFCKVYILTLLSKDTFNYAKAAYMCDKFNDYS